MSDTKQSESLCRRTCDLAACTEIDIDDEPEECNDFDDDVITEVTCKANSAVGELQRQESLVLRLGKKVQAMLADMADAPPQNVGSD